MAKISFWNNNHPLKNVADQLHTLVNEKAYPETGRISGKANKALDKYRRACNAYYDIFNNGGCNRGPLIRTIFGIDSAYLKREIRYHRWDELMSKCDPILEILIKEAAEEQNIAIEA